MSPMLPNLIPPDMDANLEANLHRIPAHMREGLASYIRFGRPPGHFLLAVLCNDLKGACARADEENRHALFQYVYVLTNYAPAGCWGSREAVQAWFEKGAEARRQGVIETRGW